MNNQNPVTRRSMLRNTAIALGGISGSLVANVSARPACAESINETPNRDAVDRKNVWVATFCQEKLKADRPEAMVRKVLSAMEEVVPLSPDIICLPEAFHVANVSDRPTSANAAEQPLGQYARPFAAFAERHQVNVICPIYTAESGKTYNSALVIDRHGKLVGEYRKINPTAGELDAGITPGPTDPPIFRLDCATIGIQICFDVNWPNNWQKLAEKGAEVVFWPSAFAGGQMLNALALMNRYYVVSSTRIRAAKIVEPLGDDVESTGRFGTWLCRPLNLDYMVIQGWQDIGKLDGVLAKYGREVAIKTKHVEALSLLSSLSPDRSTNDILREFKIESSRAMLTRNTALQNQHRPE